MKKSVMPSAPLFQNQTLSQMGAAMNLTETPRACASNARWRSCVGYLAGAGLPRPQRAGRRVSANAVHAALPVWPPLFPALPLPPAPPRFNSDSRNPNHGHDHTSETMVARAGRRGRYRIYAVHHNSQQSARFKRSGKRRRRCSRKSSNSSRNAIRHPTNWPR